MQYASPFRVETKTREQAAYDLLREAIVQGRWQDDQPLVVSRLAEELGVSRITISNAFKRLAGEGFILLRPHREAVVAPLDPNDVRQIYLMRAELEALSAREAAGRCTHAEVERLIEINTRMADLEARGISDIRTMRGVDQEFHRLLRCLSGMPLLAATLDNLGDRSEGYRARLLDSRQIAAPTARRHEPIIAALAANDADAASALMRVHVLEGMEAMLAILHPF